MSSNSSDLDAVLAWQLAAVEQHFIHLLTLKAWGDEERARAIAAVDEIDLPNALRLLDLMVAGGALPTLGPCRIAPGASHAALFAAERRIEAKLHGALCAARCADARPLIERSLAPRQAYGHWLAAQGAGPRPQLPQPFASSAKARLDRLFAHLLTGIEQSLVHAFVHWHGGARHLAEVAWDASAAAMMQAAEITTNLARRHQAPAPAEAKLAPPALAGISDAAVALDRALAARTCHAAEAAGEALADADPALASVCQTSAVTFRALGVWRLDQDPPGLSSPCQGFERLLESILNAERT